MNLVSELISFASGDSVNWIHAVGFGGDSAKYHILRNIDYCDFRPHRELISIDFPKMLTSFIKQTFGTYLEFNELKRENFVKLLSGLHIASKRLTFPSPFISLGSSIEDYVNYVLPELESHYISKSQRKNINASFDKWVLDNIIPLLEDQDRIDFMPDNLKQKLSALVQRNLRSRINNLLNHFGINYDQNWVGDFVKKRNQAAHGTYVFHINDYIIWTQMASLIEVLMLTELNYNGQYLDWSTSPPKNKTL